jgi:PPOX class probable F420-dependent enzyme
VTLTMTKAEREEFLAGLHVAILSVDDPGRGPLAVPVWYSYAPGGTVNVVTGGHSVKAGLLRAAGRFSLCVQNESMPYRYVSVEGPITTTDDAVSADERRALAHRYLGAEGGDLYVASTADQAADSVAFRMTPERWRTTDYGKLG